MKFLFVVLSFIPCLVFSQQENYFTEHVDSSYFKNYFINYSKDQISIDTTSLNTTISYKTFSGKGQFFELNHIQRLNDYFKIYVDLDKYAQEGVFNHQIAKLYDLDLAFSFQTDQQKYSADFLTSYQKFDIEENGGVIDYNGLQSESILYTTFLDQAKNEGKNKTLIFSHKYSLNKDKYFKHEYRRVKRNRYYSDNPISGFYSQILSDSILTNDSLNSISHSHQFLYNLNKFNIAYRYLNINSQSNLLDSNYLDHGIDLSYNSFKGFRVFSNVFVSGVYKFILNYNFGKTTTYTFNIQSQKQRFPIWYNQFVSNHFRFNNSFKFPLINSISLKVSNTFFTSSFKLEQLQDYIYFNENSLLDQHNESILFIKSNLKYSNSWGPLNLSSYFEYNFTDTKDIIRIPSYYNKTNLYLKYLLFDNNLDAKFGFKFSYFSKFKANGYNPLLANYFIQNNNEIGGYPVFSPYFSFSVSGFDLTILYRNLSDLFLEDSYEVFPGYPYSPANFEILVKWQLD